jgi:membrane fusion protein (multidrug efflux system)
MPNVDQSSIKPPAGEPEGLRSSLDRIAAALENRNALARKKEGADGKQAGEANDDANGAAQKQDKPGGKGKAKGFFRSVPGILFLIGIIGLLVIGGVLLWRYESTHESTDDSYTAGHVHQISPRVPGLVLEVWVDDNQTVKGGDLLVRLDPRDYEVALQQARANLDQAKAQVLEAESAVVQAQADYAQSQAQAAEAAAKLQIAAINYRRNRALYTKDERAVAAEEVDTTQSDLNAAQAALDAADASVQAAKSMIGTRQAQLAVAQAAVETNQAAVASATLNLSYCWVLSPCDGRVSRKTVETGQRLSAGQALMAVTESDVWVLANFKETQLARVRVGQPVKIAVDAFKGHPFTGRVDSIQDGSGATYSLLPPDNATGNFTKIVQRVPVKITFDRESVKGYEDLIVPGLSNEPVINFTGPIDNRPQVSKVNTGHTGGLPRQ